MLSLFSLKSIVKLLIFCTIDFAIPLWYLIAMVETYAFWLIIVKYKKETETLKLILPLLILDIIITIFCESNNVDWFWKINFVTKALPWFLLGHYFNLNRKKIARVKNSLCFIIALMGLVISEIPIIIGLRINFSIVGSTIYAMAIFVFCVNNISKSISRSVEYIGNKLSLNIYIFHVLIGYGLGIVENRFIKIDYNENIYLWIRPLIVLILTVVLAQLIETGKKICLAIQQENREQ